MSIYELIDALRVPVRAAERPKCPKCEGPYYFDGLDGGEKGKLEGEVMDGEVLAVVHCKACNAIAYLSFQGPQTVLHVIIRSTD